ncbi:MAG: glucoamylase family protein [Clostridia bacterium]|nr:glucoamylase family protein [Clostridia bacterium]
MRSKNKLIIIVAAFMTALLALTACAPQIDYTENIDKEVKGCFDFFWQQANSDLTSDGYGIIADRFPTRSSDFGSIASIGFGLSAIVIGVERGYITQAEGEERVLNTLKNLVSLQTNEHSAVYGMFYHFLDMDSGTRYGSCEVSTIDTALLIAGALHAGEFFGGEVKEQAEALYSNVNWKAFEVVKGSKTYISMGYNNGAVLSGCWDWYAEQLILYVLGAGTPVAEYRISRDAYYDFTRNYGSYGEQRFIFSYFGSLFTYQYSQAWVDFRGYTDEEGVNWYDNSVSASKAAYEYAQDYADRYDTFSESAWGLTACDSPDGYSGFLGSSPRGWQPDSAYYEIMGTVAPSAALGSVVFTPEQSLRALANYQSIKPLNSRYGLFDSYNLDKNWYASDVIGIDKGVSMLMLHNYQTEGVWNSFMKNEYVLNGLAFLGISR